MKIRCSCGTVYEVKAELEGKLVRCSKCDASFVAVKPPMPSFPSQVAKPTSHATPKQSHAAPLVSSDWRPKPQQKSAGPTKAQREQALLSQYTNDSLESRIGARRADRIESNRVSAGVKYIVIGVVCWVVAVGGFMAFQYFEQQEGGFVRVHWIVAILYWIGGKWFVAALFGVAGALSIYLGIASLARFISIDEDD